MRSRGDLDLATFFSHCATLYSQAFTAGWIGIERHKICRRANRFNAALFCARSVASRGISVACLQHRRRSLRNPATATDWPLAVLNSYSSDDAVPRVRWAVDCEYGNGPESSTPKRLRRDSRLFPSFSVVPA